MNSRVIADTGPIIGLVRKDDQWSAWSSEEAKSISAPYLTCETVIAEASFLLQNLPSGRDKLYELIELGVLHVEFSLTDEISHVRHLMQKYADLPMSLADACLVRMSELYDDAAIFTVDSDFLIYRKNGRKKIPLISPF